MGLCNCFMDEESVTDIHKRKKSVSIVELDDFEKIKEIGHDSFGKMVIVKKKGTEQKYYMKIIDKSKVEKTNHKNHILTEKEIMEKLESPFIQTLTYSFQTKEQLFLVSSYIEGGQLSKMIRVRGVISEEDARLITAEIILAIEALHQNDVIYRNLKPCNVLFDSEGHVLLTDFSLSKFGVVSSRNKAYTFCGTMEYLAPEIIQASGQKGTVDWWCLGILLYEMLFGEVPFRSENERELMKKIIKQNIIFPSSISSEASSLISSLLIKNQLFII